MCLLCFYWIAERVVFDLLQEHVSNLIQFCELIPDHSFAGDCQGLKFVTIKENSEVESNKTRS